MEIILFIKYCKQPDEFTCGQACLAVITGKPIENFIQKYAGQLSPAIMKYELDQNNIKTITYTDFKWLPKDRIFLVLASPIDHEDYIHWFLYSDGGDQLIDPNKGNDSYIPFPKNLLSSEIILHTVIEILT